VPQEEFDAEELTSGVVGNNAFAPDDMNAASAAEFAAGEWDDANRPDDAETDDISDDEDFVPRKMPAEATAPVDLRPFAAGRPGRSTNRTLIGVDSPRRKKQRPPRKNLRNQEKSSGRAGGRKRRRR
jgi:hypothetical protein